MAARFWVGGTGNWDAADTTHWAATSNGAGGQSVPTASDDVIFDASSGGGTVTITATQSVRSITGGAHTGTLNFNGQTVTMAESFSYTGSGVRTLTLSGNITVGAGATGWNIGTTTNLTFSDTSIITCTGNTLIFAGGNLTYNDVRLTTGIAQSYTSGTFVNFTRTGTNQKTCTLTLNANMTVTGTFTCNGNSVTNRILVASNTVGTARTITAATVTVTNADFQDITGAGAGSWDLSAITGNSGDCGGNSGITFTTAATQTYTGGTDNWSTAAKWTSRVPLPQDDVLMSGVTGGTITADMPRLGKSINWTGASGTPAWALSISCSIYGSITLITAMTVTGSGTFTLAGRGNFTITNGGSSFSTGGIAISAFGGKYTLQDAYSSSGGGFSLLNGEFDSNSFTLSSSNFVSNVSTTRILTLGTSTWSLATSPTAWAVTYTNLTVSASLATLIFTSTNSNAITFNGGGQSFGTITRTAAGASRGAFTIQGSNTIGTLNVSNSAGATTLNITAGTTQTITTFNVFGTVGNVLTLQSTSVGSPFIISKPSGTVSTDYLTIIDSTASGGATFYAGANSTDGTGNTGWIFTAPPAATTGDGRGSGMQSLQNLLNLRSL